MQPLATTRKLMMWLCMCPVDETTTRRQRIAYIAHTLAILIICVISITTGLAYCIKFISIDFDGAVFGFMAGIAEFGIIYVLIAAVQMRYQIELIFTGLLRIYKSNENHVAFRYLVRANNTSERICAFYLKYAVVLLIAAAITSVLSVLYSYVAQGKLEFDHLYRPAKFLFPWNQATLGGYFAEICMTLSIGYAYFALNGTQMLLFISMCVHHQAFSKMFKHSTEKSEKCDAKLLRNLIRFHISIQNWFMQSADVYSPFVLVQLICSTFMMAVSIFYLDLQSQHMDFIMLTILATLSIGMSTLLVYCYLGKVATESYEMMPDCLFEMNWHELSIELQKYFILMIANMQKPLYYHGFEVAKLDLQTFVNLFRRVFSFYIAIKTISSK